MADPIKLLPHQTQPLPAFDLHAPTGSGKSVVGPLLEEHIYSNLPPVMSRSVYKLVLDRDIGERRVIPVIPVDASGSMTREDSDMDVLRNLSNTEEFFASLLKGGKS